MTDLLTEYNHRKGRIEPIRYIVIHYVGATGSAKANCEYYASGDVGASAHYFVDFDGEVWRSVKDEDTAWHCGASKYVHPECRNANSIGIEMCVRNKGDKSATSRDWYFEDATVEGAINLTRELMAKYNIPEENVLRHYDCTGKTCPNPYVYNHTKHTWDEFRKAIQTGEWVQNKTGWKYKTKEGFIKSAWRAVNGHWYYFNEKGYAVKGLKTINGARYYFETSGDLECALMKTNADGALVIWDL